MKKKDTTGNDLTTGSIPKHMAKFALPMLIGLIFNMGFGIVDMMWIGNLLGKEAMGAAAISFSITMILIGLSSGSTMATSILVSQNYGSKNFYMVKKVINHSWYLFLSTAALIIIFIIGFRDSLLHAMKTPVVLYDMVSSYLVISLLYFFVSYVYQIINATLSGMGDTKTPMIFLIVTTCINIILDPIFIKKMRLDGAAYATLLSWMITIVAAAIYLKRKRLDISLVPKEIHFDKRIAVDIVKIGLPSTIKACLTPISLMFMTAFINRFGADAISAYGAASKIDYLAIMPGAALGVATSVMTGQNIGAEKLGRVKHVLKYGILLSISILCMVAILIEIFPKQVLSMFASDPEVLSIGQGYLRINAIGYCIFSISYITDGFINGHRKTLVTMAFSMISLIILRIPLAKLLTDTSLGIQGIWVSMLITYVIPSICGLIYSMHLIHKQKSNSQIDMSNTAFADNPAD
jgi:putative MATE family efflux protein